MLVIMCYTRKTGMLANMCYTRKTGMLANMCHTRGAGMLTIMFNLFNRLVHYPLCVTQGLACLRG